MERKTDRRIRKTKKQLQDSFTSLLLEKNIKDITVKELCEKVDLNRGTFYLHYKDIYDMSEQLEDELLDHFQNVLNSHTSEGLNDGPFPLLLDLFILIKENSAFCKALLCNNRDINMLNKFKLMLRKNCFNSWMVIFNPDKADKFEHFYNFILAGCIGVIESWLVNGLQETPEEISATVCDILLNGSKMLQ